MKTVKGLTRWICAALAVFIMGNGLGYVFRTYECRTDRVRIYVAAPGYEVDQGLPERLYALQVTRCTLPEQWGGDREPLQPYP
ncbi:hypothetical protein [Pseudomonas sp. SLFW]|uniref:hypothetical protein n=1 Tax=Pseudomonas sp. SLFW TaxID=2683259 RepID=UPI001412689E|nr:hypothetical protein [Pseudomonas sp. SLFW]NBB11807.1 hypothetical protein [Pseudomonas sp. SLFW]